MLRHRILSAAVLVLTAWTGAVVMAQPPRDAGAKMRGEFGGTNRSANRSMRHAYDYSRDYRMYSQDVRTISPQTAKAHAEGVGNNIAQAKKDFSQVRKEPGLDKQTLADLDQIDKHLEAAAKVHSNLHEMCMKDNIDAAGSMKCCDDINSELAKALALHDKLMKRLTGGTGAKK